MTSWMYCKQCSKLSCLWRLNWDGWETQVEVWESWAICLLSLNFSCAREVIRSGCVLQHATQGWSKLHQWKHLADGGWRQLIRYMKSGIKFCRYLNWKPWRKRPSLIELVYIPDYDSFFLKEWQNHLKRFNLHLAQDVPLSRNKAEYLFPLCCENRICVACHFGTRFTFLTSARLSTMYRMFRKFVRGKRSVWKIYWNETWKTLSVSYTRRHREYLRLSLW